MFRRNMALRTDERVRLMDDVICGIRVIKMYAWEKPFAMIVHAARKVEMAALKKLMFTRTFIMSLLHVANRGSTFATVLAMYYLDSSIPADKVFLYISLLTILSNAVCLQTTLSCLALVEGYFSIGRLESFMVQEEFAMVTSPATESTGGSGEGAAVLARGLSARWVAGGSGDDTLSDMDLHIARGQLVVVIGRVGSGKSSLLQALMGELPSRSQQLQVVGTLSYASQDPWVFPASLRQNVLFSRPHDQERYSAVLRACALQPDVRQLPWGDSTPVGARGVSLSGGQKARLNLARAAYSEADIYLLDDPLSAVDASVGRQLFHECILTFLKGKTRVLVTHQLQYLEEADHVVLMNNGRIELQGSYQTLCDSGVDFGRMVGTDKHDEPQVSPGGDQSEKQSARRPSHLAIKAGPEAVDEDCDGPPRPPGAPGDTREDSSRGKVVGSVWLQYLKSGLGWWGVLVLASGFLMLQMALSACDYWVAYWVMVEETRLRDSYELSTPGNSTQSARLELATLLSGDNCTRVYIALIASVLLLLFVRSATFVATSLRNAAAMHDAMFRSIMHARIRFFDVNPPGRIINRFSKDLSSIDETLQKSFFDASQMLLSLLGNAIVITVLNQISLAALSVLLLLSVFVRNYFLKTTNNMKMLDGISKSPVFSHMHSSLQGLACIRASGAQPVLCQQFDSHQDVHTSASYCYGSVTSAFSFLLDLLYVSYTASLLAAFLLEDGTKGSEAGLIISQLIATSVHLQWGVQQSAELSNNMTSVERALEYSQLPAEPNHHSGIKPPDDWPSEGKIEFEHVYFKYAESTSHVLIDINATVNPKEKVGIVGRTGAGKSSLVSALLRTALVEGSIRIDGLDTKDVNLCELRGRLSVIPQDPVLFRGTLRSNLDPFARFPDDQLWAVLRQVGLQDASDEVLGLETRVHEGGGNLSVGQRQLVCLARAILRGSSVLLLDEATANVDTRTDKILQTAIREQFAKCTVLTVAHRLNTIMDCDRLMVINAGRLVEWGEPHVLLQNKAGLFHQMVKHMGSTMAEQLSRTAEQKYTSRPAESTRL
ncbi:ATP-binding cassette sub-family C member 4-like isoform X2 [Bacillus rossius redtenbacheri]